MNYISYELIIFLEKIILYKVLCILRSITLYVICLPKQIDIIKRKY